MRISSDVAFLAFFRATKCAGFSPIYFDMANSQEPENAKNFFPSGAVFFFVLLLLFYAAIWFLIYWIMISRS
jgi:hypothetical protein